MMRWRIGLGLLVAAVLAGVLSGTFMVPENEWALGTRSGEAAGVLYAPGLHFGWPLERIARVERRVVAQSLRGEAFLDHEQMGLVVDVLVLWRVTDVAAFVRASGGDEQVAAARLADNLRSELKARFAQLPLAKIVGLPSGGFSGDLLARLQAQAQGLGLSIVAAYTERLDATDEVTAAIAKRMQAGFAAQAAQARAQGAADAERLRAEADRNRGELLAGANRDAQRVRGEGDAQAAALYARVYGRSPEFAMFYRSLQAYRAALGREGDLLVIEPEGEFYKYLRSAARH